MAEDNTNFFKSVISTFTLNATGYQERAPYEIRVLDFGCGRGDLVRTLGDLGYSTYGCDVVECWSFDDPRLKLIGQSPYRIPFEDESFDFVISTSVLEHVQNKNEVFMEMNRVLKKGGMGLHLYPSKWYLPYEPHVYIPFMNFLWPRCPRWYLSVWAILGVRNTFQSGKPWHEVVKLNHAYGKTGISYWSNRRMAGAVMSIFGNCDFPVRTYMQYAAGKAVPVLRAIFGAYLGGLINNTFRMSFLIFRKEARSE